MPETKRAMVTGASSGIGREFAVQLAARGYAITAVARREDKLRELLGELPGDHHRIHVADLSSEGSVQALAQCFASEHFTLLVNNAGYSALEPFYSSELGLQQNMLHVNCASLVSLAHAFLRDAQAGDALINLASVVAYMPTPAQPVYSASKAFISVFSECLWHEQRGRGIYVMGLCPGLTTTGFIGVATAGRADGQSLPASMTQSAQEVVGEALVALDRRRKAIVVTGWKNRAALLIPRFLTRHGLIRLLGVLGDPERAL